jgi:hypothetical protein
MLPKNSAEKSAFLVENAGYAHRDGDPDSSELPLRKHWISADFLIAEFPHCERLNLSYFY